MTSLKEKILEQNVLEEHRQVHDLQVRIKELRGDITRYMTINAELLGELETARAELKAARKQEPAGYVFPDWRGATTVSATKDNHFSVPLYAAPIPAPAPEIPDGDDFNGTTLHLIQCIEALVRMNDCGVLAPHGIGGHARTLLLASANRLRQQPAPAVPAEWRGEWEHTKGGKYRVLMLPNGAAADPRYPLMVVYQGQDGNIWARPAHDWHRSMTLLKPAGEKS